MIIAVVVTAIHAFSPSRRWEGTDGAAAAASDACWCWPRVDKDDDNNDDDDEEPTTTVLKALSNRRGKIPPNTTYAIPKSGGTVQLEQKK